MNQLQKWKAWLLAFVSNYVQSSRRLGILPAGGFSLFKPRTTAGRWARRAFLSVLTVIGFTAMLYGFGIMFMPEIPKQEVDQVTAQEAAAAEEARDVSFDPLNPPVIQRDVDYAQGPAAPWFPKGETSYLRELVQEGRIDPVDKRVGPEPLVLEGVDGIGKYGGSWLRVSANDGDISVISNRMSGATLVRWSPMGDPVRPHLAKGWEVSEDQREWTLFLRQGIRWSDGAPFTADDIMYWWEVDHPLFSSIPPQWLTTKGEPVQIVKVDDYTVKFIFQHPYGAFIETMAGQPVTRLYTPRHYLIQYHPELGNQELIQATMKAKGLNTPKATYNSMRGFLNPEMPSMNPWIYRTFKNNPPHAFVRNPYYWAVDPEGNQLPYVDRVLFEVKNPKLIALSAASGDITMQARNITYDNYTMLMEGREKNNYRVLHWFPASRSVWTMWPNGNRRIEADKPETKWKAQFLADKRFRQALSLAIDRQKIIRALYNGVGEPAQIDPGRESAYHNPALLKSYTEYLPERASAMLDDLGLGKYDVEGMRTFPDGSRMTWYIDFTDFTGEGPSQFVISDWARIGVRAVARERPRSLYTREQTTQTQDFAAWSGESEFNPLVEPRSFVPTDAFSLYATGYGTWFAKGGFYGVKYDGLAELTPSPAGSPYLRAQELLEESLAAPTDAERIAIFKQITDIAAENVWSISISTPPPQLVVVKNGFKNVPENAIFGFSYATPANAGIETFYFENPSNPPAVTAQIKEEMVTATPAATAINPKTMQASKDTRLADLIQLLVIGIVVLSIILLGVRHPFIGKRLVIMGPTLLIISILTFTIIQLPPGDYIETRILDLALNGDSSAAEEIERMRSMFLLDQPVWKRYVRWMGLEWFFGFDSGKKGLLQGEMGYSMESLRSVNGLVGDRVLLTFVISLATILFTWAVAMPIGIYSAVRQYSIGDYILTFIGFIGMCVPNFLLAILLMYWSGRYLGVNVTGLFSPEFASDPSWSWPKVVDLLKHVWVPVVVIAIGGTAGMIRVMRGNLLDELRKPYVTTAMAKGVRPFRLLMKYPVRLALNPFISGIGGIFPQLVSGGAIVAIILSLPMVGPIMLQGIMTEDVYLAASMLMVLSLLGMFGTLVSDILLLWLDPRIRLEGGSR